MALCFKIAYKTVRDKRTNFNLSNYDFLNFSSIDYATKKGCFNMLFYSIQR